MVQSAERSEYLRVHINNEPVLKYLNKLGISTSISPDMVDGWIKNINPSATYSHRWTEIDMGIGECRCKDAICKALKKIGSTHWVFHLLSYTNVVADEAEVRRRHWHHTPAPSQWNYMFLVAAAKLMQQVYACGMGHCGKCSWYSRIVFIPLSWASPYTTTVYLHWILINN